MSDSSGAADRQQGLTLRSVLLGLVAVALVCRWIHQAELVVGQRGHSALANTSIPLGAFYALLILLILNALFRRVGRWLSLSRAELLVVYVMMTTSTVIASSGGIHFLVPAILAPFYFPTPENQLDLVVPFIPDWFAPQTEQAVLDFYRGNAHVPYSVWLMPTLTWLFFLGSFLGMTICLSALLRRQWVDRERLTFPTVVLPLEATRADGALWRDPVMWGGFAVAAVIGVINNLHANLPSVPDLNVRYLPIDQGFSGRLGQALRPLGVSFYPFVIGIGYLLSLDVTFSCWFFYFLDKLHTAFAAGLGLEVGGGLGQYPYSQEQGAGAFLALALISIWFARHTLVEMARTAFGKGRPLDDSREPMSYRTAFIGFAICFLSLVLFCSQAGMNPVLATIVLSLSVLMLIAATRIRAETGNAWLYGPMMDPHRLVLTVAGRGLPLRDLTIMAFLRSVSNFDMRCQSMPHQLDGFKMADSAGLNPRGMTIAIIIAVLFAIPVALILALEVWYQHGALAGAEPWRTTMGRRLFEEIIAQLLTPARNVHSQLTAVGVGAAITVFLTWLRAVWVSCPLHPIGYAMAGTNTMRTLWMPFLLAWMIKLIVLRAGGMRLYRRTIPFFLGLIIGDFVLGGTATMLASVFDGEFKIYPINW